jgi:hypothetical protein
MVDIDAVAGVVVPYLTAAAGVYGGAVVQQVADRASGATADAAARFGRRVLDLFQGSSRSAQVEAAVVEVAEQPGDTARIAVLRAQVLTALADDPGLAEQVRRALDDAPSGDVFVTQVRGGQGVQVGRGNTQHNTFGPSTS